MAKLLVPREQVKKMLVERIRAGEELDAQAEIAEKNWGRRDWLQLFAKWRGDTITALKAEVELAIAVTSSLLLVRGVELVGKIPPELQNYLVFEASVGAAARQPEAGKALIKHLTSPEAAPVIKAKGWEPATR